jgi:hypothetical protein
MGTWNYRVCKETYNKGTDFEEVDFSVREVYYNNTGEIWAAAEKAAGIYGESVDEVRNGIEKLMLAVNKEVVDLDTIVYAPHS